ncbi:hypothetical protein J6590_024560 [Homalodisca vitripennis]|nr:hypothetical protein J6590_024560 [Homalodisca vitripennis]
MGGSGDLYWEGLPGLRQIKAAIDPKSIDRKAIFVLSGPDIRLLSCPLNYHLLKMDFSESEIGRFCRESALHIICDCKGIAPIRRRHLHRTFLKSAEVGFLAPWHILKFSKSSPYSIQNHQEVVQNNLLLNGDRSQPEQTANCETSCLAADHKPVVDTNSDSNPIKVSSQNVSFSQAITHWWSKLSKFLEQKICDTCFRQFAPPDPEQQVKELLASAKVISEGSPVEDLSSTRLPGFHQAFGSTEIGRFSQPDGFFEAAVAAENERKVSMSPLPPPPPKRGRAPRGGRKAKSRAEPEKWPDPCLPMGNAMVKKDSWQDWNPGLQPGCDNAMNSLQRMNCYPYHEDQRPPVNCPHPDMYQYPQWHSEMPYYERQNCNQYYPPYYNPPQEQMRSYHDCYTPYDYPPPSWRGHPYYHPSHFPHHQNVGYYQQYSEYRHYGYQNNRWAVNREIKYSSGMV